MPASPNLCHFGSVTNYPAESSMETLGLRAPPSAIGYDLLTVTDIQILLAGSSNILALCYNGMLMVCGKMMLTCNVLHYWFIWYNY